MDPALLAGLAGLASGPAALAVALACPLELRLGAEHDEGTRATARVTWLFGLVDHEVAKPPREPPPEPEAPEEPDADQELPSEAEIRAKVRPLRALVETPGFLVAVRDLLTAWVRAFAFEHVSLRACFGTGDPAETGHMWGALQVAMPPAYALPELEADLVPDYDRARLEGRLEAGFGTTLAALLAPLARFLLAPATLDAAHAAWEVRPRG